MRIAREHGTARSSMGSESGKRNTKSQNRNPEEENFHFVHPMHELESRKVSRVGIRKTALKIGARTMWLTY